MAHSNGGRKALPKRVTALVEAPVREALPKQRRQVLEVGTGN
jgi:hypothetical protein